MYNAIVWQDSRTLRRCEDLRRNGVEDELIRPIAGLYSHTYFSATKLEWVLKHIRDGFGRGINISGNKALQKEVIKSIISGGFNV